MEKGKTNIDEIKKLLGLQENRSYYNHYKQIHPDLTVRMYNKLSYHGRLWEIECGKRIEEQFSKEIEILKEQWWLKNGCNCEERTPWR